jgi:hypothetical protein
MYNQHQFHFWCCLFDWHTLFMLVSIPRNINIRFCSISGYKNLNIS